MNANTALKINDAIDQAIRCGEGRDATLAQVERALARAEEAREAQRAAAAHANEKVDSAKAFGHKAAAVLGQAFNGTGIPATSLLDGVVTFVVHAGDEEFVVKAVRVERYPQESF